MRKLISIVIPSRLAARGEGELWLERALSSVAGQQVRNTANLEVVVGLDHGCELPGHIQLDGIAVRGAAAGKNSVAGQASALNAALADARGEFIAILEDDDLWQDHHLNFALLVLEKFDFASSNQLEVDEQEAPIGIHDFPTPSGWVFPRALLDEIGFFDESYALHLDNDWLGRLNLKQKRRCHMVEATTPRDPKTLMETRLPLVSLLQNLPPGSGLARHKSDRPSVIRTINSRGGMSRIAQERAAKATSDEECARLSERYGFVPW